MPYHRMSKTKWPGNIQYILVKENFIIRVNVTVSIQSNGKPRFICTCHWLPHFKAPPPAYLETKCSAAKKGNVISSWWQHARLNIL